MRIRTLYLLVAGVGLTLAAARPADAQFETPDRQFHNATAFPLDGRHRDAPCESCHRQDVYKGTPTRCFDCHWVRRQDDRYRLELGMQCEQCHRPTTWTAVRWNHGAMTGFRLNVSHAQLSCQACHGTNTVRAASAVCVSCHQKDYQATRSPNHVAAGFPTTCETCHRRAETSWRGATFNHASVFPLVGRHAQQACATCHVNNRYRGTPRDCVGCHRPLYDRTTAPNHAAVGFPPRCENCHRATDTSWGRGTSNHRFPITSGPHRQSCTTCHQGGGGFQTFTCLVCHAHSRARMDGEHGRRSGYRYESLACYGCHPRGRG